MSQSMKLVDILARELKVWPDKRADYIVQDHDGECWPSKNHISGAIFDGRNWSSDTSGPYFYAPLSSDYEKATVTREQWQAAVDALKAAENVPTEWNGEGLPPVGTICECKFRGGDDGSWQTCEVIAHKDKHAICWADVNNVTVTNGRRVRPIRTAEQIAADEREKAITEIAVLMDRNPNEKYIRMRAGILYDAGWRKQADQ